MFKSWRSDKKKIKVVFQLQFQATQVPKLKKSGVTIALVPEDVGKPTLRLEKVAVQDGSCLWENPVYETVKLIMDQKTGKLSEKIYHFVVSNGSSKAGFLGEASIDFADFAAQTEPISVSLPLKFANSGAILHVTVYRIEGGADQRYVGDGEGFAISRDNSLQSQDNAYSFLQNDQDFAEDGHLNTTAPNGSLRQNSMLPREADDVLTKRKMHRRTNTDWSVSSTSDGSLVESGNSPENVPKEWQEGSENSVQKLRSENVMLLRQIEMSELELQSLRKQILKENKRTQDFSKQIIGLKEERDEAKTEFERFKKMTYGAETEAENEEAKVLLEETRQELNHEKDLNTNLRLQLQKTEDSNSNLVLAVRDLNEMLEQKNKEISHLSSEIEESIDQNAQKESEREQYDANEVQMMKQTIADLNAELEFHKKHKEELEMHIEELSQENENISSQLKQNQQRESVKTQKEDSESLATINELESQAQRLEDRIKQQSEEYSESLITINELEGEVKELKNELQSRTQAFEDDLNEMICAKTEQEQRAIQAEEALRKTRWKNAVTAERLQEEFKKLSVEMATKFDENEKKTMKAVEEANELHVQNRNLEEMLHKANEERQELSHQLNLKEKEIVKLSMEVNDKTAQLEHAQKQEKEKQEAFSKEIHLLKTEIEKLREKRSQFSDQVKENGKLSDETKRGNALNEKTEMMIQRWNKERDELERKIESAKKETEKAQKQLISTRSLKDKKEMAITNLQSEMKNIRAEYNDLKHSLVQEEMEKEKLRKQLSQLKNELQKKEEEISSIQKELRGNGGQADITSRSGHSEESISAGVFAANVNKSEERGKSTRAVPVESDNANLAELLSEMECLKERNKSMERELKDMEERYSEISLKFAEVEGERQQLVMTVRNLKNGKKS